MREHHTKVTWNRRVHQLYKVRVTQRQDCHFGNAYWAFKGQVVGLVDVICFVSDELPVRCAWAVQ